MRSFLQRPTCTSDSSYAVGLTFIPSPAAGLEIRPTAPFINHFSWILITLLCGLTAVAGGAEPEGKAIADQLRRLNATVLADARRGPEMLAGDARRRLQVMTVRENQAWERLKNRADWEKFRDQRLQALRASLGEFPAVPKDLKVRVTRTLEGDGYCIENLVFESRPGMFVAANLYVPARPPESMPGIVIVHSHHNPAHQGELQDMGMTWARNGCLVLVPELIGHGERRQHPFVSANDYPQAFRVGRQDYHFRYVTGLQLNLIGESLMGWFVWDVMRCLDVLLARPGVDRERIILLGAVAGGGDPAGVIAALDSRVQAVVPFNFGGVQPDYPVPGDPVRNFYFFGKPSWESTRCLRRGAADGFAHWLIVSSVAPRHLIYAHEFAWDRAGDPAWPRLQQVFAWYDAPTHLASAMGQGTLKGTPPESSHCNNIGPLHRSRIYPTLKQWFGMPIPEEYSKRRTPDELVCMTPEMAMEFKPRSVHELAGRIADGFAAETRQWLAMLEPTERGRQLRQEWARHLGDVQPKERPKLVASDKQQLGVGAAERLTLEVEPGIIVPMVFLTPAHEPASRLPCVVGVAWDGKEAFLKQRADAIAELLNRKIAVALPDVRGTGETRPSAGPGRYSSPRTTASNREWLLGQTLAGSQLRDLRSVLQYLRTRPDLDGRRFALWGDSFAPVNSPDRSPAVPLEVDPFLPLAEPVGGLLAVLGALYEEDTRAVAVHRGLAGYRSLLDSPFCYVPHDVLAPGVLRAGDLCDVTAALAPRPVRLTQLVDGLNRTAGLQSLRTTYTVAQKSYHSCNALDRFQLDDRPMSPPDWAQWLAETLQTR